MARKANGETSDDLPLRVASIVSVASGLCSCVRTTMSVTFQGFGFGLAVMVMLLLAFVYALAAAVLAVAGRTPAALPASTYNAVPVLAFLGLGVAGYIAFVGATNTVAVCGPVGDCNAVQSSPYARLFGVVPIGLLGIAGYLAILGAWTWSRLGGGHGQDYAALAVMGMALFGTLFSLYLTYLEPFVIQAVCLWCLASAVTITLLMLVSLRPAMNVIPQVKHH